MRIHSMTTRKLFAATTLVALAGVAILGGVFAWRTSDSARGAALVGANGFEIRYEPVCSPETAGIAVADPEDASPIPCLTLIGYNGVSTLVGKGSAKNGGDFRLRVVEGSLRVRAVLGHTDPTLDADEAVAACGPEHFRGSVRILNPGEVIPPGGEGGKFAAYLTVAPGAPARCQGKIVLYKVTIVAENPQPTPAEAEPVS